MTQPVVSNLNWAGPNQIIANFSVIKVSTAGRRHFYRIADDMVDLDGYGQARQISVFESGKVVFQVLSSDTAATAARMVHLLRCRWRFDALRVLAFRGVGTDRHRGSRGHCL